MRSRSAKWLATLMALTIGLSAFSVAPVAAQADWCRGGGPEYWLANPWPAPFKVPTLFRQPNGKVAVVKPFTKFDSVFRYRNGRDSEGAIFPGKTLKEVLKMKGTSKKDLARESIAALLNSGEPENEFWISTGTIIKDFQVYWDGTGDLSVERARKHMTRIMRDRNAIACPVTPA